MWTGHEGGESCGIQKLGKTDTCRIIGWVSGPRKSGADDRGHDHSEFDLIFSNSHRAGEHSSHTSQRWGGRTAPHPRTVAHPLSSHISRPRRLRGADAEMPWRAPSSQLRPWYQTPGLIGAGKLPWSLTSPSTSGPRSAAHDGRAELSSRPCCRGAPPSARVCVLGPSRPPWCLRRAASAPKCSQALCAWAQTPASRWLVTRNMQGAS